ncbi:MAG TPA: DNA recombination protein RmuC [Nevskiaceae bacterium]|nr:DNA recombination protein RmuC [Nevskiaceae bacterium]
MTPALILSVLLALALAAVLALWLRARPDGAQAKLVDAMRDEVSRLRGELGELSRQQRQELGGVLGQSTQSLIAQQGELSSRLAQQVEQLRRALDERFTAFNTDARAGREEGAATLHRHNSALTQQLAALTESNAQRMQELRGTLEARLKDIQSDNAAKLEEMRRTVDEKLHATLELRLGESFKLVSERLEQVHKGLGEMQSLASGVGDLKRVLSNVKTRGVLGEGQLGSLLEQVLTPEQYARNVATRPGSAERVEFAIRMPGGGEDGVPCWLPIDAKFPREDYERLQDAYERADPAATEAAASALERRVKLEAQRIREKYLSPPHTTDFAILFVPIEGLYAEVLRRPGLFELLQREQRIIVAGPVNLLAILNSLQMGFRTLAIEKRSSEVWQVLGAVKTEFAKYGEILDKVKKKLDEATSQIEQTGVRSRAISRRLREVQALPAADSERVLGPADEADSEES